MDDLKDKIRNINVSHTAQLSELIKDVFLFIKDGISEKDKDELLKSLFDGIKESIVSGIGAGSLFYEELFFYIFDCKRVIKECWNERYHSDFDESLFDRYEFNENYIRLIMDYKLKIGQVVFSNGDLVRKLFNDVKQSIVYGIGAGSVKPDSLELRVSAFKGAIRSCWNEQYHSDFDESLFDRYEFNVHSIRVFVSEEYEKYQLHSIIYNDLVDECHDGDVKGYLRKQINNEEQSSNPNQNKLSRLRSDLIALELGPNYEAALKSWGMLGSISENETVALSSGAVMPEQPVNKGGYSHAGGHRRRGLRYWFSNLGVYFNDFMSPMKPKRVTVYHSDYKHKKKKRRRCRASNSMKVINYGENKKIFLKGILGVSGFVSGLALSSMLVPVGVRLVGIGISAVKLISNKFPEGRVANVISNVSDSVNKLAEKPPKISAGISRFRKFLKKDTTKFFTNNLARGYLVGNIIEMVTGYTPFEHIKNLFDKGNGVSSISIPNESVVTDPSIAPTEQLVTESATVPTKPTIVPTEPVMTEPTIVPTESVLESGVSNSITESVVDNSGSNIVSNVREPMSDRLSNGDGGGLLEKLLGIELNIGDIHDISGLGQGYTSSDGLNLVSLNSSKGAAVMVDKFGTSLDGELMVHFKQLNGDGYAWFKVSAVQNYLHKFYTLVPRAFGKC